MGGKRRAKKEAGEKGSVDKDQGVRKRWGRVTDDDNTTITTKPKQVKKVSKHTYPA